MAIITPSLLTGLNTAFAKQYQDAFGATKSEYAQIATTIPSQTKGNTYGWLGQFPRFREWIGDRVIKDMSAAGYSITNKDFETTIGIKRTDIEDDNLGIYSPIFQEMGRAAAVYPDELVFPLLAAGTLKLCYDGQNFFDTDHPVYPNVDGTGTAVSVSNYTSGTNPAWYLLDVSRALKPLIFQERQKPELKALTSPDDESVFTSNLYRYGVYARSNVGFGFWQMAYCSKAVLDSTSFNAAFLAMQSLKADGGRPLGITPTLLVVPPSLRADALELLTAERLANGASNTNFKAVEMLVTPWVA
ncbi:MAG: Mu-like prophage major head subunit gpT family protein [Deltaproteobacteria bacterium]